MNKVDEVKKLNNVSVNQVVRMNYAFMYQPQPKYNISRSQSHIDLNNGRNNHFISYRNTFPSDSKKKFLWEWLCKKYLCKNSILLFLLRCV